MRSHPYSLGLALAAFAGTQPAWGQFTITRHFPVNQTIPDAGELLNAQTVDLGGGNATEVRLTLNIARGSVGPGFNGDLYVGLGHLTGYAVLLNRPGRTATRDFGYADGEGFSVTFADNAAADVHNYRFVLSGNHNSPITGPLTGSWQPDGRNTDPNLVLNTDSRTRMLANFNGLAANGEWRLFLSDVSSGGLSRLTSWGLTVTTTAATGLANTLNGDTLEFTSPGSTFNNSVTVSGNNTVTGSQGATLSGNLDGTGTLTHAGTGTLALSGANTFTGGVALNSGTLAVGNNQALGTGPLTLNGGTISSSGGARSLSNPVTLTGNAAFAGPDPLQFSGNTTLASSPQLTVNTPTTFSGTIDESSSGQTLVKLGTGRLTLSAANTFSGGVTIAEGTLAVNNTTGSATGSGAVIIGSGGTLTGNGRITGDVTVQSGANLSPGSSPGTLETGSQTWTGGGLYTWEINQANGTAGADPGWDLLDVSGSLTITASSGNPFQIGLTSLGLDNEPGQTANFNSGLNYSWKIVSTETGVNGFDALVFNLSQSSFQNSLGGGSFGLSLANGGKDLHLNFNAVPEPTAYGLVAGFGLLGLALWRRQQTRPSSMSSL